MLSKESYSPHLVSFQPADSSSTLSSVWRSTSTGDQSGSKIESANLKGKLKSEIRKTN